MNVCLICCRRSTLALTVVAWFAIQPAVSAAPLSGKPDIFNQKIWPILRDRCAVCHGAKEQQSGLRVDSRERLLKGGTSGPAIVPGKPGESLLIEAVAQTGDLKMPLKGKLSADEVSLLRAWVSQGAPWSTEPQHGPRRPQRQGGSSDCCTPAR